MGSGCSAIDSSATRQPNTSKAAKGTTFAHYAATLPKLFCEALSGTTKLICSCNVTPNYKSIVFACTDAGRLYYQKLVSPEELKDIVRFISNSHQLLERTHE